MVDLIVTGASRGIGRALVEAAATRLGGVRFVLVARDAAALRALAARLPAAGAPPVVIPGDLSTFAGAQQIGERLNQAVRPGATLVHNAGLWPAHRERTADGLEKAFATNHVGPLLLQRPLLREGKLARILVIGAGLMVKGAFDPGRTPTGEDFSSIKTYCNTKLAFAVAMRDVAAANPQVDTLVMHPGVVRTDLGARRGVLGWVLSRVKRAWESPEVCAARLVDVLEARRWSPPGQARWRVEKTEAPWPQVAEDLATRRAVREVTAKLIGLDLANPAVVATA